MKTWIGLAVLGFVLVTGILILRPDKRGWTPEAWTDPATIVDPIDRNDPPFSVGDCLPGTIDPYQTPRGHDYGDIATVRVFTCRSWSSAMNIIALYLLAVLSYPAYRLVRCKRSK